ncbi:MAG: hypothetical protein J6A25_04240 [Lachnospiraceae bacterium]|nr:hypothetical protein [Lachnospiraceae bacterium]
MIDKDSSESIELVYFKLYSDFSYNIRGKYELTICENTKGYTVFSISKNNIYRNVMIIMQKPISVFYNVAPDELIRNISSRLIEVYHIRKILRYKCIDEIENMI